MEYLKCVLVISDNELTVTTFSLCTDGLQVLIVAALPSVWLLRRLQFIVCRAQRLVLMGTQHALWLLVNLW